MPHRRSRMLILAIDDDPLILEFLGAALGDLGEVLPANGGEEGLAMARRRIPNLIICDLMMPGVGGLLVCERLQEDPATRFIPVLCMSVHSGPDDEIAALAAGASDFIKKPIAPPLLRARAQHLLRWHKESSSMRELSLRDDTTGLFNRRHFDERLAKEWARRTGTGGHLAVAMVDIDRFKEFNDCFGHLSGDECLSAVASRLAAIAQPPGGLVSRYGGEEFVFLAPDCSAEQARALGAAICEAVRAMRHPHSPAVGRDLSVSVGVASAIADDSDTAAALLRRADEALYQAKAAGRDRHVVHGDAEALAERALASGGFGVAPVH